MDLDKIPTFTIRELTKEEWKEMVDALSKQGKPTNPFDGMNLQAKEQFDKAIRADFEKQFGKFNESAK